MVLFNTWHWKNTEELIFFQMTEITSTNAILITCTQEEL